MKKIFLSVLVILLSLGFAANVSAQDAAYLFRVEKEVVHVYWNADGSQSLDYVWDFTNQPNAHPIDFVDVGTPNSNFEMNAITADVDGVPVSVSKSDYQGGGSGFAVVMGAKTIPAGGVGGVHVSVGKITNVLHPDDKDKAYASAVFTPQWFGAQYLTGPTDLTLTFHLPPNMKPEEPRWHKAPGVFPAEPQAGYDEADRVTYTWHSSAASASESYEFGASFPRSYVPADSIYVPPPPSSAPLIDSSSIFTLLCCGFFAFTLVGAPVISAIQGRRRKMQYLPPQISIEGHGIKRGLTAVESAIVMEQPLDKVMTMILFGAIKKNAASVKTRNPLEIDATEPLPTDLHEYESAFLKAFKTADKKARQTELQDVTIALIKSVSEKMRGFSRQETLDYYKSIMEKAWQQVETANTPEVKSQKFDEALEWTMLDNDYDGRTRRVFSGPVYVPMWWGRYDPTYRPASGGGVVPPSVNSSSGGASSGLPGADFAASMVTGVQTFAQSAVGNISTFTEKITGATNPPPKPTSSGGGGGRSCACACACAGCACACAGGGR